MAIHIKKSHRGLLHKNLGVAKGKKIPASKLTIHKGDSPALKKRKQFAINAKKWHHEDGGMLYQKGGLKPETRGELLNYHMSKRGKSLGLDKPGKQLSDADQVLKAMDVVTTNQKRTDSFYGNKPAEGVSQKVFDAHKAVRDKARYEAGGIHLSPEAISGYVPGDATMNRLKKGFVEGGIVTSKQKKSNKRTVIAVKTNPAPASTAVAVVPKKKYSIEDEINRVEALKKTPSYQDGGYTDANLVSAQLMQANTYPVKKKKNVYLKKGFQAGGTWSAGGAGASGASALGSVAGSMVSGIGADKYGVTSTGAAIGGGALSGAALGTTILPGWGTLIGAVIGGAVGGIKNKMAKNKRTKALEGIARAQKVQDANQSETALANYDNQGTGVRSFARGGSHPHGGLHTATQPKTLRGYLVSAPGGYGNDGTYHFTDRSFLVERDQNNKKLKAYQQGGDMAGAAMSGTAQMIAPLMPEDIDQKRKRVATLIDSGERFGYGGKDWARAQGVYQDGGMAVNGGNLQPISDNAYEVKGNNPQATDDVQFQDAYVDHGEVLKPGAEGTKIFSDHLTVPGTKTTFAKAAKKLEKSKSLKGNPNPNQDALVESKLKSLFHTQQRLNNDSQGESTEEAIQPQGETPGRGMSEGNMFALGGTSPNNVTYHDMTPARIGSNAKEAMATGVMSRKYYNIGGMAEKIFEVPGFRKELKSEPGHGKGSGTFQGGGMGPNLPSPYAPPITYTKQNPNLSTPLNLYNSRMNAQGAQYLMNNVKQGPKGPYLTRQDYHQVMNIARGEKIPQFPTEPTSQSKLPMYLNLNEYNRADSTVSANRALQYSTPSLGYTDAMKYLQPKPKLQDGGKLLKYPENEMAGPPKPTVMPPPQRQEQINALDREYIRAKYPWRDHSKRTAVQNVEVRDNYNKAQDLINAELQKFPGRKSLYNCGGMRKRFAVGGVDYDVDTEALYPGLKPGQIKRIGNPAAAAHTGTTLAGGYNVDTAGNQYLGKGNYKPIGTSMPALGTTTKTKSNINWSNVAGLGASLAGNIHNAMALKNMPDVAEVSLTKAPRLRKLDYSDQKAMLKEGLNTALKAGARNSTMRQAQEGSQAASLAEYSRATNQMHGDVNRTNAQISNEEAQLGWRNNLNNNQITNQYRQDQQQRLSAIMSGESANIADVGNKVQGYVAQGNAMKLDQQKLDMNLAQLEISAPGAGYRHLKANGYTDEQAQQIMARVGNTLSGKMTPQGKREGGFVSNKKPLSYKMGGTVKSGSVRRLKRVC